MSDHPDAGYEEWDCPWWDPDWLYAHPHFPLREKLLPQALSSAPVVGDEQEKSVSTGRTDAGSQVSV